MYFKNVASQGVYIFARDTVANTGKTGDAANITVYVSKDGGAEAESTTTTGAGNVTEIGRGFYWCPLTQAETNADAIAIYSTSVTANVVIDPLFISTTAGAIPKIVFGLTGGIATWAQVNGLNNSDATLAMQTTIDGKLDDVMGVGFVTGTHSLDQTADTAMIADALCDENIVTAHGTANSLGMLLRAVGAEIAGRSYNNTLNDLLGVPDAVGATVVTEAGGGSTTPYLIHSTSVATVASQTSMTLTSGSTDNNAYTNCLAVFTDQVSSTQKAVVRITAYTGATRTVTLEAAPAFVVVLGDSVSIVAESTVPLSSSTVSSIRNAVMNDDVTARLVAGSAGKAINTLTTLGARTNNANLNSLLGVADEAATTAVRSNYFCRHKFIRDGQASMDEYSCVRWWKDDEPLTTGITSQTIRVIHGKTGADLIPQTSLTEAGSSHLFYYEATGTERIAAGQAYSVVYRATIDGEPRVSEITIGRDVA